MSKTEEEAKEIVDNLLKRNPQLANHVGESVGLDEFAFAIITIYKAHHGIK